MKETKEEIIERRMKWIANELGVELDEEFNICFEDGKLSLCNPHRITKKGLIDCHGYNCHSKITDIITIKIKIEKIPFKDRIRKGGAYFFIDAYNGVCTSHYNEREIDEIRIKSNNIFETKEEAEQYELVIRKKK